MSDVDNLQAAEEAVEQQRDEERADERARLRAVLDAEPLKPTAEHTRTTMDVPMGLVHTAANMRIGDLPAIEELAISIREVGLIHPLLVRELPDESFRLVAGRRRLAAVQMIHDNSTEARVRCEVITSDADEAEAWLLMLTENIQREDPPPMQVALALRAALHKDRELSASGLARQLGKSPAWASRHIHLLDLPEKVQWRLEKGDLNFTIADLLRQGQKKGIITDDNVDEVAESVASGETSVTELKDLVRPHVVPENYEEISAELDAARWGASEQGFEPDEVSSEQRDWDNDSANNPVPPAVRSASNEAPPAGNNHPDVNGDGVKGSERQQQFGARQLESYLIGRLLSEEDTAALRTELALEKENVYDHVWQLSTVDRHLLLQKLALQMLDGDDALPSEIFHPDSASVVTAESASN